MKRKLIKGSSISYVRKIFRKTSISYTLTCAYQGVANVSVSQNVAYILSGRTYKAKKIRSQKIENAKLKADEIKIYKDVYNNLMSAAHNSPVFQFFLLQVSNCRKNNFLVLCVFLKDNLNPTQDGDGGRWGLGCNKPLPVFLL